MPCDGYMPIVDYDKRAKGAEEFFFNLQSVSEKNKAAVRKFQKIYDVSSARKAIFFKHINLLLEHTSDIMQDMHNRDKINDIFAKLRKNLSPAYYGTAINVSLRLITWLNDGEKPKGFKDVKNIPKDKQRRALNPNDMITWQEGELIAAQSNSIQMKAIVKTELDAGLRPSEFVDLKYGDLTIKKDIIILHVKKGKTGGRDVPCQRCTPAFLQWYHNHPCKQKDAPLFCLEFARKSINDNGGLMPYSYAALKKRIKDMAKRAGIDKPVDFYNLRHSSCALDKKDNLPIELAADRHGHSVSFFTKVYGRLSLEDVANRMRRHYGGEVEKHKPIEHVICNRCDTANEKNSAICSKCASPLTMEAAQKLEEENTKRDMLLAMMNKVIEEPSKDFREIAKEVMEENK